ncbi:MAG: glycosyltransferase family 2 protein [Trueperaceae bacterium]
MRTVDHLNFIHNAPFVSIVLPVRNESQHIGSCLSRLLEQDYPKDRFEILVVDGDSADDTREVVQQILQRVQSDRLRLLANPERIVPAALNIGIRAARGSIIVRMDGHTVPESDYVSSCVRALNATGAANVGGPMLPAGETEFGRAVAVALQHPFGVGDARFHIDGQAGFVDTVYMGAFRRDIFEASGLFDESMVRNQDYEMNVRIRNAGGRIYLDPTIRSRYTPRGTWSALWKQYFEYGWWRVETLRRHRKSARWRQLLPATFVLSLLVLAVAAPLSQLAALGIGLLLATYVATLTAAAVGRRGRAEGFAFWNLPLAFVAMHVGYGSGFLLNVTSGGRFPFKSSPPLVPPLSNESRSTVTAAHT